MTTTSGASSWQAAAVLFMTLLVACGSLPGGAQGRPAGSGGQGSRGAARPAFDGGRAYGYLRQIVSFGPRPPGSVALEQTRQYIKHELKAIGIDVVEQAFDAETPLGRFRMVNLIARIPGASPERVIFAGHYDTKLFRPNDLGADGRRAYPFVGANDAGSSTAFLMEWARVLKGRPNRFTSEILFLDGEESLRTEWADPDNRYGSRHYVRTATSDGSIRQVKAMILVDMIGDRDLVLKREAESTRWLTDVIWRAGQRLGHTRVFVDEETSVLDDHMMFLEAGVPAVDLIDMDYVPWHTANDTLDKVSVRSLQIVGDVLLEALPEIEKRLAAGKRQ
jgi:Zn-dependent M28 family amino/carboxypeptidase